MDKPDRTYGRGTDKALFYIDVMTFVMIVILIIVLIVDWYF